MEVEKRLYNKPKKIKWKIIAGGNLDPIQMYDLVYDKYDYKIRQLEYTPAITL